MMHINAAMEKPVTMKINLKINGFV